MSKNALPTTVMIGGLVTVQLFGRASVKREFRLPPTKNRFADRTPLLLRRYFTDNNARFVSGRILKLNV